MWKDDIIQSNIQKAYEQGEHHLEKDAKDIVEIPQEEDLLGKATDNKESSCHLEPDETMSS